MKRLITCVAAALLLTAIVHPAAQSPGNRPERLEWFRDLGFGLFIHWSVDSQIGSVKDEPWRDTPFVTRSAPGWFTADIAGLSPWQAYDFRAVVRHPLITTFGEERSLTR